MKKRLKVFPSILLTALLLGCGADSTLYSQVSEEMAAYHSGAGQSASDFSSDGGEEDALKGSLTIKTFWEPNLETYVQDFVALHPETSVEIIQPGQEQFFSFDDYLNQTAVELMSGSSADIVDVAGFSVFKYAKSGVFCDLYGFMDSDPEFDRDDYYQNIFKAKEFNGALYSLPCGFTYNMLYGSKKLLEESGIEMPGSLDYTEIFRIQDAVSSATGKRPKLLPGLTPYTFFWNEYPEYYDLNTRSASFSSRDFIRYLQLTKERIPTGEESDFTRLGYDDSFMREDYLFCLFDVSGGTDLYNFLFDFQNVTEPALMASSSGKLYFRTMREYSIVNASPRQQLAWKFLKYYIGEKEVPQTVTSAYAQKYYENYNAFVPINISNFFNSFRFTYEYSLQYISQDPAVRWKAGNRDEMVQEALLRIDKWNRQRNAEQAEGEIYGALCEDLNSFYELDLLTPEETAERLQNRMLIFLRE